MADADLDLIDRYLARRLSELEREIVEARIVAEPQFRRELELTVSLRDGLHRLDAADGLEALLKRSSLLGRPAYALVASVAAGGLALLALVLYQQLQRTQEVLAVATDSTARGVTQRTSGTALVRISAVRGPAGDPDAVLQISSQPVIVEFRLDVSASSASAYSARLDRIEANELQLLLQIPRVAPAPDGQISLFVHSGLLEPGNYRIDLLPVHMSDSEPAAVTFKVRVTD